MALSRLRALWRNLRHDRVERDLDDEMKATLDLLIDEKLAAGVEPREARRRAMIELAALNRSRSACATRAWACASRRSSRISVDAVRHFRRAPGFAIAAVATLALGIGANTAMYSVFDTLAFQRLAIADPDGLYSLSSYNEHGQKRYVPMPTVIDLNREVRSSRRAATSAASIIRWKRTASPSRALPRL